MFRYYCETLVVLVKLLLLWWSERCPFCETVSLLWNGFISSVKRFLFCETRLRFFVFVKRLRFAGNGFVYAIFCETVCFFRETFLSRFAIYIFVKKRFHFGEKKLRRLSQIKRTVSPCFYDTRSTIHYDFSYHMYGRWAGRSSIPFRSWRSWRRLRRRRREKGLLLSLWNGRHEIQRDRQRTAFGAAKGSTHHELCLLLVAVTFADDGRHFGFIIRNKLWRFFFFFLHFWRKLQNQLLFSSFWDGYCTFLSVNNTAVLILFIHIWLYYDATFFSFCSSQ